MTEDNPDYRHWPALAGVTRAARDAARPARPVLFSAGMIRAILDGKKTQTRRAVRPQPDWDGRLAWFNPSETDTGKWEACDVMYDDYYGGWEAGYPRWTGRCPYGDDGDWLWVRETHAIDWEHGEGTRGAVGPAVYYRATDDTTPWINPPWKPSIHMPRWASRITLEIVKVRTERLQGISTADACAEGAPGCKDDLPNVHAVEWFKALWDSINTKRGYLWASNPWVWVLEFRRVGS